MPIPSTFMAIATPANSGGTMTGAHLFAAGSTTFDTSSSSSSSSSSSDSSASSASSESSSSSSYSSWSSQSSSSSSDEEPELMKMSLNAAKNIPPILLLNGNDPGPISQIDQMTYKYKNVTLQRAPVIVEMITPYENSEIRYETNGKNPGSFSKLYNGPLVFRQNGSGSDRTVIKARIYSTTNSNVRGRIIRLQFNVV